HFSSFHPLRRDNGLEVSVVRPAAAFGRYPIYILAGVLDVARFAVDAVLRVDLETWVVPCLVVQHLIHASRAISCRWLGVFGEVYADRHGGVAQNEMNGL